MADNDLISIGKLVGTFGVQGAVKVVPMTDFPQRFKKMKSVLLNFRGHITEETVEWSREHGTMVVMKFTRFNTPEEAIKLKYALLQVKSEQLYPLPEGEHYIFQLIGLEVHDEEKGYLGQVAEVLQTGANDVYVVQGGPYGEILIPALKQVVPEIDITAGKMTVKLLPGLLPGED